MDSTSLTNTNSIVNASSGGVISDSLFQKSVDSIDAPTGRLGDHFVKIDTNPKASGFSYLLECLASSFKSFASAIYHAPSALYHAPENFFGYKWSKDIPIKTSVKVAEGKFAAASIEKSVPQQPLTEIEKIQNKIKLLASASQSLNKAKDFQDYVKAGRKVLKIISTSLNYSDTAKELLDMLPKEAMTPSEGEAFMNKNPRLEAQINTLVGAAKVELERNLLGARTEEARQIDDE